jgi:hypothetical protein
MRALRHHSGREPFTIQGADGDMPIVIAMPDDTIIWAVERVDALGGHATVVVPDGENLAVITVSRSPLDPDSGPIDPEPYQAHEKSTMKMMVCALRDHQKQTHWRVASPAGDIDVTETAETLLMPA